MKRFIRNMLTCIGFFIGTLGMAMCVFFAGKEV